MYGFPVRYIRDFLLFNGAGKLTAIITAELPCGFVRGPLAAQSVVDDFKAGAVKKGSYLFDGLAAPSVASEGSGFLIPELQSADHLHDAAYGEQVTVIDGRRANEDGFGFEDFRDDIVFVVDS